MVATFLVGAFLLFLLLDFSIQITAYIGIRKLLQQACLILLILCVLLSCYFVSTWTLFKRSVSKNKEKPYNFPALHFEGRDFSIRKGMTASFNNGILDS